MSVVIAYRNAEDFIGDQLESLTRDEPGFPWELILVDNASTDHSADVVESFSGRLPLRLLSAAERPSQPYAQNVGASAAVADKLLFIDADDEVAPGLLGAMYAALCRHELVGVSRELTKLNPPWLVQAHREVPPSIYRVRAAYAFGSAIGISRQVLETVGGHPEDFPAWNDLVLTLRADSTGVALHHLDTPLLHYRFRPDAIGTYEQTFRWGRESVLVHREFGAEVFPPARVRDVVVDWWTATGMLVTGWNRVRRAKAAIEFGYLIGRLVGSVRAGVLYL